MAENIVERQDKIATGDSYAYGGVVRTDALVTKVSSINVLIGVALHRNRRRIHGQRVKCLAAACSAAAGLYA